MNDKKEPEKKGTLSLSGAGKLSLNKPVGQKQHFSHGRNKTVVEVVRKSKTRAFGPGETAPQESKPATEKSGGAFVWKKDDETSGSKLSLMSEAEKQRRLQLLKHAEEEGSKLKDHPQRSFESNRVESPAEEEDQAKTQAGVPGSKRYETRGPVRPVEGGEDDEPRRARPEARPSRGRGRRDEERRNSGKITVSQALNIGEERMRSIASMRRQREKARKAELHSPREIEKVFREVTIPEVITVQELANRMTERAVDVVKALMKMGTMVTVNQSIDADTAELIVLEFGHKPKRVSESDVEDILKLETDAPDTLKPRAPVVTVMGHVDHGKTSLLDALRKTDVVAGEAGGITQHIGAYQVTLAGDRKVTFLDTPGHEAFTSMRARGAKVTDIVVLVVAADDGVKEQTKEAISHAKAAGVPIIVAINKIDKPGADATRVKNELMQYELVSEEMGGETMMVEVSAKQNIGLEKLVETILLQAEVMELTANPDRPAAGVVIEAKIDRGRGVVATLLLQRGTLRVGDLVVAGTAYGNIRAMSDDKGSPIKEAGPAMPVEVQGLDSAPEAGDEFAAVENEKTARDITAYRKRQKSASSALAARSLDKMFAAAGDLKELALVIKGDVQGSVEAIAASVMKFSGDEVSVKIVHSGVGGITESDITLANATNAIVIGFNVRANAQAKALADREKIDVRYYSIIYNLVDDIKAALGGLLSPVKREKFIGNAEIRQVFNISKVGKIAGCMVTDGVVKRGAGVRLLRDNVVIHEGTLKTLKRFKDEVKEVKSGFECGMAFENYDDIREGDVIEAFEIEETARTIEDVSQAS